MQKCSAEVEQERTAKANISAATSKSKDNVCAPESGGEEGEVLTLLFSKDLALKINKKRPDVTAALILFDLYLWQKISVPEFRYTPQVKGQRGSYRSLSEIQQRFPWLSEEAIRKAILRAERALKGQFVVDRENANAVRNKLHFWISPSFAKLYNFHRYRDERKGMLALRQDHAKRYGVLEAILIFNLEYITDKKRNKHPLVDEGGLIYRELSPTALTKPFYNKNGYLTTILPYSRKAVTDALRSLVNANTLIEHGEKRGFYRMNEPKCTVTKVADIVTRVAGAVTKVAGQSVGIDREASTDAVRQSFVESSDTNTDTNSDTKCLLSTTASLRSPVIDTASELSFGAKKLKEIIDQKRAELRQNPPSPPRLVYDSDGEFCEATNIYNACDIDLRVTAWHEHLPYDIAFQDLDTSKPFCRKRQIDAAIKQLRTWLRAGNSKLRVRHMDELRELFEENPFLRREHVEELLNFIQPQNQGALMGVGRVPKKGHDGFRIARQIGNWEQFLRYLPQLTREWYCYQCDTGTFFVEEPHWNSQLSRKPIFDYREMPEPFLSLAFRDDTTTPIYYKDEYEEGARPVYYAEFVGLPTMEIVDHEYPILSGV